MLFLALSLLFIPVKSYGLEIYSLITEGCTAQTGLIVNADDTNVYILNLDGELALLERKKIELILVYNIHDNPIKRLRIASDLEASLREVYVDDNENTHFIGWPIRFIEDLIMFYDIDGKTHLVDIGKIKTFSDPKNIALADKNLSTYKPVYFGMGDNLPECKREAAGEKATDPTRLISDKIRIHKFFSVYQNGFTNLKRFQKKTLFYAKPFLYDKETRLGLIYTRDDYLQELHFLPPLYFQWSSGNPYGSQGQYAIGSQPVELLPAVEPLAILRADAKSHFITGTFVGNLLCLSGGSDCIIQNRQFFTNFFSTVSEDAHAVYTQFNYMALTGVDFQEYSLSAGFYYPIYGIWGNGMFREIKSNSSSPVFRFKKTTRDATLQVVYSQSRFSSNTPADDAIDLIQSSELDTYTIKSAESEQLIYDLSRYDLKARYLRMVYDYDISGELALGMSAVVLQGEYFERFAGKDYRLDFLHLIPSVTVKQRFGNYTTIKGDLNYFSRRHEYKTETKRGESDEDTLSFAITIEFFL